MCVSALTISPTVNQFASCFGSLFNFIHLLCNILKFNQFLTCTHCIKFQKKEKTNDQAVSHTHIFGMPHARAI